MSYKMEKIDANLVSELNNGDPDHLENVSVRIYCFDRPREVEAQALAHQGVDDPYAPQSVFLGRISRLSIANLSKWGFVKLIESQFPANK